MPKFTPEEFIQLTPEQQDAFIIESEQAARVRMNVLADNALARISDFDGHTRGRATSLKECADIVERMMVVDVSWKTVRDFILEAGFDPDIWKVE